MVSIRKHPGSSERHHHRRPVKVQTSLANNPNDPRWCFTHGLWLGWLDRLYGADGLSIAWGILFATLAALIVIPALQLYPMGLQAHV